MASITKQEAERLAERFARSFGVYSAEFTAPEWAIAAIVAASAGQAGDFIERRLDRTITVAHQDASGQSSGLGHFALDVEI
jgi:hypothetical protein